MQLQHAAADAQSRKKVSRAHHAHSSLAPPPPPVRPHHAHSSFGLVALTSPHPFFPQELLAVEDSINSLNAEGLQVLALFIIQLHMASASSSASEM